MREMKILTFLEVIGKEKMRGEESETSDESRDLATGSKHPSETTEGYNIAKHPPPGEETTDRLISITDDAEKIALQLSNLKIHPDTAIDEFDRHRKVPESNLDCQNLIHLLYNEGCISLLHKQHIKQQPTQQLQNLEMLQLIQNGSIKTFKVASEYFRGTNQDHVFDMLNREYCSEGIIHFFIICIYTYLLQSVMNDGRLR